MKYVIIDRQTGKIVGEYTNRKIARNRADKLDNQYGGYRYLVKIAKRCNECLECHNFCNGCDGDIEPCEAFEYETR
ncbi:MAG TPA: hypothetical protein VIK74_10865 [Parasegetibacter sp.]